MRIQLTVLLFACAAAAALADESHETGVLSVIDRFFAAMTDKDIETLRTLMTDDGIIYGYQNTPEGLRIVRPTHQAYLDNLASGHGTPVERYWGPKVMVQDRIATVWTEYDFHVDGEFSHCGLNNFSLLHTDGGWVITGVVFSIRTEDCGESPLGPFGAAQ